MTTTPRDPFRPKCDGNPSRPENLQHTNPMRPENMRPTNPTQSNDMKHEETKAQESIKRADASSEGMTSDAAAMLGGSKNETDPMRQEGTRHTDPTRPAMKGNSDGEKRGAMMMGDSTKTPDGHAADMAASAKETAADMAGSAKGAAEEFAESAKGRMRDYAEAGKERGAERIGGVARAIHGAADSLEKESPVAASYVRQAATGIDHVSQALSRQSVDDLVGTVQDYGRRNPALLFGGALLAGVVLSRFIKSSGERRASTGDDPDEPGRHGSKPSQRPPGRETGPAMRSEAGLSGRTGGSAPTGRS